MKINVTNKEKVNEALNAVNKQVRNAYHHDVLQAIRLIELDLEKKGLLKKYWEGLRFRCNPHPNKFPNAYKGTPMATYFSIMRYPSGWFLVDVARKECRTDHITLVSALSEEQLDGVIEAFYKF